MVVSDRDLGSAVGVFLDITAPSSLSLSAALPAAEEQLL